jgi:hypothetical protein
MKVQRGALTYYIVLVAETVMSLQLIVGQIFNLPRKKGSLKPAPQAYRNSYYTFALARKSAARSKICSRLRPASAYMAKMFSSGVSGGTVCEAARM